MAGVEGAGAAAAALWICVSKAFAVACGLPFCANCCMRFAEAGSSNCRLMSRLAFAAPGVISFLAGANPNIETSSTQAPSPKGENEKRPSWFVIVVTLEFP
jgi:hypothetical protein